MRVKQVTVADIVVFDLTQQLTEYVPAALDAFPLLAAHRKRMAERPAIAAYMSSPRRHPPPTPAYVAEVCVALGR